MNKTRRTMLALLGGTVMLTAAACSSGSSDTASSSSTTSAAAASSAASPSSSSASSEADVTATMLTPTGPTISAGGSSTELDAQSAAWFTTFCGGLSGLTELQNASSATPAEAGQLLSTLGTTFTQTAQQLASAPPPTFDGGAEAAASAIQAMQQIGPTFVEFGQKAATIPESDTAAAQQFATEFQQQLQPLQGLSQVAVTPETQQAIAKVPACAGLFGTASGGAGSTTSG